MADDLRNIHLDELPKKRVFPRDEEYYAINFEFLRRHTRAQIDSAEHMKQSVEWMKRSAIVLALFSFLAFVLQLLTYVEGG